MSNILTQSFSESFHDSLVAQHNMNKRKSRTDRKSASSLSSEVQHEDSTTEDGQGNGNNDVSVCVQCLLCMIFVAVDISSAFTIVYSILFMQFLGVPTNLVSLSGVICGCSAITMLPIIGWLSDRGSNPLKRKIGLISIGISAYALGYVGLIFCSAMRLYPTTIFKTNSSIDNNLVGLNNLPSQNNEHTVTVLDNQKISDNISQLRTRPQSNVGYTTTSSISDDFIDGNHSTIDYKGQSENHKDGEFTYISILGIISFALLDIAYDTLTSLSRAFVLECTAPDLHSRLLVMATAIGAASGCCIGVVGSFDIPGAISRMFPVDGTPATILVLSCAILMIQTVCIACTLITGYVLMRRKYKTAKETNSVSSNQSSGRYSRKRSKASLSYTSTKNIISDHKTNQNELLLPPVDNQRKNSYHAIRSRSYDGQNSFERNTILPQRLMDHVPFHLNEREDDSDAETNAPQRSRIESADKHDNKSILDDDLEESQPKLPAFVKSNSVSMSLAQSNRTAQDSLETWKHNGEPEASEMATTPPSVDHKTNSVLKNKRFVILCGSIFFTAGCVISFMLYGGNALTIGVYHGDPMGLQGSPGRQMYNKGLRNGALGYLVSALSQVATSILMKKIVDLIGESGHYIMCQFILMGVNVSWVLNQREEMYFVTAAGAGFHRISLYNSGFVLANRFVQEDCAITSGTSTKRPTKNIGQVMVIVGMTVPSAYLLVSTIMGPLMSATGNAFVPIMYGAANACMSLMVFSLLYVVKK